MGSVIRVIGVGSASREDGLQRMASRHRTHSRHRRDSPSISEDSTSIRIHRVGGIHRIIRIRCFHRIGSGRRRSRLLEIMQVLRAGVGL